LHVKKHLQNKGNQHSMQFTSCNKTYG